MDNQYPLTLDHVRQFLATKQDDDVIGICFNAMHCLLSDTLNWLYPEKSPWRVDIGRYDSSKLGSLPQLNLDKRLESLRIAFDYAQPLWKKDVTKAMWREYLQKRLTEEDEAPFTVADLFPEPSLTQQAIEAFRIPPDLIGEIKDTNR